MRTCAQPVALGLCPKMKYHPLCGWMIISWEGPYDVVGQRAAKWNIVKLPRKNAQQSA